MQSVIAFLSMHTIGCFPLGCHNIGKGRNVYWRQTICLLFCGGNFKTILGVHDKRFRSLSAGSLVLGHALPLNLYVRIL